MQNKKAKQSKIKNISKKKHKKKYTKMLSKMKQIKLYF